VGLGFGEGDARKKGEQPDQAAGAVFGLNAGEELPLAGGDDARKSEMRCAGGEMREGEALHVHKGFFAGGMHDFEDKRASVRNNEVEIVVVLAGKRTQYRFQAIEIARDARGVRGSEGRSNASFRHHAENCNGGETVDSSL
jgi:hypothetical protein